MPFRSRDLLEPNELLPPRKRFTGTLASLPKKYRLQDLLSEIRSYSRQPSIEESMDFLQDMDSSVEDESPELETSWELSVSSEPPSSSSMNSLPSDKGQVVNALPASPPVLVTVRQEKEDPDTRNTSFSSLRITYLLVTLVVMLADGMQGTHLYVLYESYGYSVASLYCLGFLTGGLMSPITGPFVDRIGRKKSAILYCLLEMFINGLEQYPYLPGLIASRMIGGFTTNLLCQVFETWLDTEYRRRGLQKEKYEIIMRDSVIVSNLAAIFSGYLAHILAEAYGARGPFRGAVCCTGIALAVVSAVWTENYGSQDDDENKDMLGYFREAVAAFRSDASMLRVGIIQGLSAGSIQIFIFLWAPALRGLAQSVTSTTAGLDSQGEPAYGIIFGAFMAAGVLGGMIAPPIRRAVTQLLSSTNREMAGSSIEIVEVDGEELEVQPMAVEFLAALCYLVAAFMLAVPCLHTVDLSHSFSTCLAAFLVLELLIGVLLPCEGVIRSLYFPTAARASIMSFPRIIVNGVVSVGVASTNFVTMQVAFAAVATMMLLSAVLQLSLVSTRDTLRYSSVGSECSRWGDRTAQALWHRLTSISNIALCGGGAPTTPTTKTDKLL